MKILPITLSLLATASISQAALYMNTGLTGSSAGIGPSGTNSSYLSYTTAHEGASTGQLTTFSGISFSEGGLAGTYNVGVAFTWPGSPNATGKQAFDNRNNPRGFGEFWESWIGTDTRVSNANSFQLNLTGLEPDQAFTFTSYHADTADQGATFTVDQTRSSSETSTSPFSFTRGQSTPTSPIEDLSSTSAYSFDVTSDGSGNLDITYTLATGTFVGINGFDLVAVPEPSSLALFGIAGLGLVMRRRR